MRIEFDEGTLVLRDAPEGIPYAEWDDRIDEYRAQAYRYRALREMDRGLGYERRTGDPPRWIHSHH